MKQRVIKTSIIFLMGLLILILLYPLLITFTNSFMGRDEIIRNYGILNGKMYLIPEQVTLKSYMDLLVNKPKYLMIFWNSIKITLPTVIGQGVVAFMAAYTFTRAEFKGKDLLFFLYVIVMLLPIQVVLVPNYMTIQKMGLLNSKWAIILPGIFNPFGVFLLTQFMKGIPKEYVEAAQIDGAKEIYIIFYIFVPIMKAGIFALAILMFVEYWNVVEPALVFIQDIYKQPLSVFLSNIDSSQVSIIFAASCFYMLPVLLVFLYGQDYLVEGIELSGVKG